MQISCPSCTTTYDLAPTALGGNGRSVRCTRCRNVWFATPTAEPVEASVAAVEGDSSVPQDPIADKALSEEGRPSGEFEWSLEQTPVENESAEPAKAPDLPAGTNPAQGSVEAVWPAVDTHPIALAEAPSLVPASKGRRLPSPSRIPSRRTSRWSPLVGCSVQQDGDSGSCRN